MEILIFVFTKQSYVISKENYPVDLISCKFVKSMHYICAYLLSNEIKIIIVKYINQDSQPEIVDLDTPIPLPEEYSELDNLFLYDTDDELYKILRATKNENRYIQCLAVYIKIEVENDDHSYVAEYNIFELTADYSISYFKKHRCYLTVFNSEFLLCCGGRDIISCYRNQLSDFQIINQFTLNLIGSIESVLITDYSDHAIISYMNVTSTDLYLYQYNIYIPKCNINIDPISIEINSFGYYEIDLSQIIVRMTNTKYFIKFNKLPLEYGILKIDEREISNTDDLIEITPEMNKLSFTSNNDNFINSFEFSYDISIHKNLFNLLWNIFNHKRMLPIL